MAFLELFSQTLLQQWQAQSAIEIVAMLLAIAYVWLASQANVWCWPAGLVSTALYSYVYFDVSLVFQMLLNVYYMLMAIWGFITWRGAQDKKRNITVMSAQQHVLTLALGVLASVITFYIARIWFEYELVWLDITLTVFSLLATYLTVKKMLQNWYYWSAINCVTAFLVWQSELYLTSLLMVIYVVIAVRGLRLWRKLYQQAS